MQPIDNNERRQSKPINSPALSVRLLRAVVLPLAIGWLWALLVSFVLAQIQANEIARSALPARLDLPLSLLLTVRYVPADILARLDFELRHGSLLLLSQVGIVSGLLAWQISLTARPRTNPRRYGALYGGMVGLVEATIGVVMGAPLTFSIPLGITLLAVGLYAGAESTAVPLLTAASADQPQP